MAERKKTLNDKDSILDLEDQARNTKQLLDRLNKAAYGTTWEEIIQAFADCVKLMNNLRVIEVRKSLSKERSQFVLESTNCIPTDSRISVEDLSFCAKCSREISQKWNYCPHCGTAVHPQKNAGK